MSDADTRIARADAPVEEWLDRLRTKREELERLIRAHEVVLAQRIAALGTPASGQRDIPANIRAEQRWLAHDRRELEDLEIAIAAIERARDAGSPATPYREGIGVAEILGKAQLERDAWRESLRQKRQGLLDRYIAAKVPRVSLTSKSGVAYFFLIVAAAAVESVVLLRWPWFLLAMVPLGIFVNAAVRELREDFRAKKRPPEALAQLDFAKAPKELETERTKLHVESERLEALEEEVAALERIFDEKA